MLGICAMLLVLGAMSSACSYWISWDLEHKDTRPAFTTKIWNDLTGLLRRNARTVGKTTLPSRSRALAGARARHE
jgi:hypothetical protein